jgi:hypothetical protein
VLAAACKDDDAVTPAVAEIVAFAPALVSVCETSVPKPVGFNPFIMPVETVSPANVAQAAVPPDVITDPATEAATAGIIACCAQGFKVLTV